MNGTGRLGWERRRWASATLRVAVALAPAGVSAIAAVALSMALPNADSTAAVIGRSALVVVASAVALVAVDRVARRLLPLAALLQLTLVFPDRTPSRFKTALKAGSGRRLAKAVDEARHHGLSDDPTLASEQLVVLAAAIGDHDRRTRGHSERVRLYAELLGEELRLGEDDRAKLQWAALVHDIGKIHVPVSILNKKGKPDAREWEILQRHPLEGEELASSVAPWLGEWAHAIGGHHERYDGTGYPRGLVGKDIPRAAAIVAIADSFEVMTAVRSYKKAMPLAEARAELTRCAGTHFDPDLVRAFLNVSLGRVRNAMGLLGSLAHLPFIGRVTTAVAYAPDAVPMAGNLVSSSASTGLGAVAVAGTLMVSPAVADTPPQPIVSAEATATPTTLPASTLAPTTAPGWTFGRTPTRRALVHGDDNTPIEALAAELNAAAVASPPALDTAAAPAPALDEAASLHAASPDADETSKPAKPPKAEKTEKAPKPEKLRNEAGPDPAEPSEAEGAKAGKAPKYDKAPRAEKASKNDKGKHK